MLENLELANEVASITMGVFGFVFIAFVIFKLKKLFESQDDMDQRRVEAIEGIAAALRDIANKYTEKESNDE